jgi:hypothetical protein
MSFEAGYGAVRLTECLSKDGWDAEPFDHEMRWNCWDIPLVIKRSKQGTIIASSVQIWRNSGFRVSKNLA